MGLKKQVLQVHSETIIITPELETEIASWAAHGGHFQVM